MARYPFKPGRLWLQPLGTSKGLKLNRRREIPGTTVVAEIDNQGAVGEFDQDLRGWLIRFSASGLYAAQRLSGGIRHLDHSEVEDALGRMNTLLTNGVSPPVKHIEIEGEIVDLSGGPTEEERAAELAKALRDWRASGGHDQATAAMMLGISRRTYEGIEAGRGFRYPQLLMLALIAFR